MKDSKSLEISCYVLGLGAFGVFFRWMQLQLAYNDNDLPDSSAWNVLVPLLILAAAYVFIRFIKKFRKERVTIPVDFFEALKNKGKLYTFCRWAIGVIMVAGSALLLMTCETDTNALFLRIVAVLGILTGISFPLLLTVANKPHVTGGSTITLLSLFPILLHAVWLLTCYKQNSINPVTWDYVVEIVTVIVSLLAAFRLAGFAYGVPDAGKSMFFCMLGAMLSVMSVADGRNMGQQVMLIASALMMTMYNWILVANRRYRDGTPVEEEADEAGFEKL